MFSYHRVSGEIYLLLYVDDIVLTSSDTLVIWTINSLHPEFSMKDLDVLHHFLGINVFCCSSRLLLSQQQYSLEDT